MHATVRFSADVAVDGGGGGDLTGPERAVARVHVIWQPGVGGIAWETEVKKCCYLGNGGKEVLLPRQLRYGLWTRE